MSTLAGVPSARLAPTPTLESGLVGFSCGGSAVWEEDVDVGEWGPPMPPVWALIHRGNAPSIKLFESEAFAVIDAGGDYHFAYRPPAEPLSH